MLLMTLPGWQPAGLTCHPGTHTACVMGIFIAAYAAFRLKLGVFRIFYGVFTLILIWAIIQ
jgi:hypothetical protein